MLQNKFLMAAFCSLVFLLDLQNVDITLRILFRPVETRLPHIYANVGMDYDERVLPSITTEVLKAVVVRITGGAGPLWNGWTHNFLCRHNCVAVCF